MDLWEVEHDLWHELDELGETSEKSLLCNFFWLMIWAILTRVACAFLMPPVVVADAIAADDDGGVGAHL